MSYQWIKINRSRWLSKVVASDELLHVLWKVFDDPTNAASSFTTELLSELMNLIAVHGLLQARLHDRQSQIGILRCAHALVPVHPANQISLHPTSRMYRGGHLSNRNSREDGTLIANDYLIRFPCGLISSTLNKHIYTHSCIAYHEWRATCDY